jgi:hypothetical protein
MKPDTCCYRRRRINAVSAAAANGTPAIRSGRRPPRPPQRTGSGRLLEIKANPHAVRSRSGPSAKERGKPRDDQVVGGADPAREFRTTSTAFPDARPSTHSSASSPTANSRSERRTGRRGATAGPCAVNCSYPHSIAGRSIKFLSSLKRTSAGKRPEQYSQTVLTESLGPAVRAVADHPDNVVTPTNSDSRTNSPQITVA